MTSAGKVHSNNSNKGFVELFYLKAPETGTHLVEVSLSGEASAEMEGGSVSFTGVDQTTPVQNITTNAGYSTSPSVAVSSAVGNMVVDALSVGCNVSSSGQTLRWNNNQSCQHGAGCGAQSTAAGASSVTMSYTTVNDWWGIIGMDVVAAAAPTSASAVLQGARINGAVILKGQ
jgi:hypothetical protein